MPFKPYEISKITAGFAGIIFSFFSVKHVIYCFRTCNFSGGNEPYRIALIIAGVIDATVFIWGIATCISNIPSVFSRETPGSSDFRDHLEVQRSLTQRRLSSVDRFSDIISRRDKSFIHKVGALLGIICVGFLALHIPTDNFYWEWGMAPEDFSFPIVFLSVLLIAIIIRGRSLYVHECDEHAKADVSETLISIRGEKSQINFRSEIEKALKAMQNGDKTNNVNDFSIDELIKTIGPVKQKILVETSPLKIRKSINPIVYACLLYGIVLMGMGFYYVTTPPPDNFAVFSVPIIAISHIWTLFKGVILTSSGIGMMSAFATLFRNLRFESVVVLVEIEGEIARAVKKKLAERTVAFQRPLLTVYTIDCHFRVLTSKLLLEITPDWKKRQIIGMRTEELAEMAKMLTVGAINSFKSDHYQYRENENPE